MVPNQYASTSSFVSPTDANASFVESMSRSSVDLSQCSPNGVHPIPTIATRSLIPCDAMSSPLSLAPDRAGLPEVVVDPLRRRHPAERELDPLSDRDRVRVDVGE